MKYNQNLIPVGDLNARHSQWHDVTMNINGYRLNEWINTTQNLKVYNSSQPTSTRSQGVIDIIIAPFSLSSETTTTDETMQVSDHYPVHWNITSFFLNNTRLYQVKHIEWKLISFILELEQTFFYNLAEHMKDNPTNFILINEQFLVALQERCTSYHVGYLRSGFEYFAKGFALWPIPILIAPIPDRTRHARSIPQSVQALP
jgi:hypothetical protein